MEKQNTPLLLSLILNLLLIGGIVAFIILYPDFLAQNCNIEVKTECPITQNEEQSSEEDSSDDSGSEEQGQQLENYKYSYVTEAVVYEPDTDKYWGYRVCDDVNSYCKVYGVSLEEYNSVELGETYELSFNEYECTGAAAGTTYCIIKGEFSIEPFYKVQYNPE
jgi:hypothetical protein